MSEQDVVITRFLIGRIGMVEQSGIQMASASGAGGTDPSSPPHESEIVAPTLGRGQGRSSSTVQFAVNPERVRRTAFQQCVRCNSNPDAERAEMDIAVELDAAANLQWRPLNGGQRG